MKPIDVLTELALKALTAIDANRSLSDTGGLTGRVRLKQSDVLVVGFEYRNRRHHRADGQSTHRTLSAIFYNSIFIKADLESPSKIIKSDRR